MDREKLIRECLVLICFLENISTNDKETIDKVIKDLETYSIEELNKYYKINYAVKEAAVNRMMGLLNKHSM